MLVAVTTCGVTLLDLTSSRPSASASSIPTPVTNSSVHCATWSTDGVFLYVAWSHGVIYKYDKSGKSCGIVWKAEEASGPLVALATRDKDTVLVAYGSQVVAVDLSKKRSTVELLKVSGSPPFLKRTWLLIFFFIYRLRALNLWCHLCFQTTRPFWLFAREASCSCATSQPTL